jgi:hypothetical protein
VEAQAGRYSEESVIFWGEGREEGGSTKSKEDLTKKYAQA